MKLDMYKPWLISRFKFEFQHSSIKTTIQNGRLKFAFFFPKWPTKPEVVKNENKMSKHIDFDPLITNMCIFCVFGA